MDHAIDLTYQIDMTSFRQLQYLVAVADRQNFRKAASSLHVSQPTLSLQLQKLEEQLEVRLIERNVNPVCLTPIGHEIVARARKLLLDLNELEACAKRSTSELVGTISLGVSPTLGPYLLPGIVGALKQEMPSLHLYIREGIPQEQMFDLRSGALDMLLTPVTSTGSDLHVEHLFDEDLHLVAPPEHPFATRSGLKRSDIGGADTLGIDPRYPFHQQTRDICSDLGLNLLGNYEGTSLDSLSQMCASGLGLAILPDLYLRSEVGGKNIIVPLAIEDWQSRRSVAAIWRANSVYGHHYAQVAMIIKREAQLMLNAAAQN